MQQKALCKFIHLGGYTISFIYINHRLRAYISFKPQITMFQGEGKRSKRTKFHKASDICIFILNLL